MTKKLLIKTVALLVAVIMYVISSFQHNVLHYGPLFDFIIDSTFMISVLVLFWYDSLFPKAKKGGEK